MGLIRRAGKAIEAFLHANTADGDLIAGTSDAWDSWGDLGARRFRYALAWGLYQNSAYRDLHAWADDLRKTFGLYKHIRNIYNPTDRLVEFHAAHVYGGAWDPEAGDGRTAPSAAPILGDRVTPAFREAVAKVWQDSLWSLNAEAWVRNGALFGDAPVKVVHDAARGKIRFELVNPKHVKHVEFDHYGHVKGYVIERGERDPRVDPPKPGQALRRPDRVRYEEHCFRDGDQVIWRTYLVEGDTAILWDWTGTGASPQWSEPFGFVPMVWTRHIDLGLGFGLAEYHTARAKVVEIDDQASKLNDQIRKVVDPKWLFSGMRRPDGTLDLSRPSSARDDSESERDEEGAIYAKDPAAKAQALVATLQIAEAAANILQLGEEVERGFPELRFDRLRAGGDVSGESLRVARQPVETKIGRRRARYDTDLVRLHQMALAIGGYAFREDRDHRLEVFAPFDLDSYAAGDLDHRIGSRPVFGDDAHEQSLLRRGVYEAVEVAVRAGLPWRIAMREAGYSEDQIDEMVRLREEESALAAQRVQEFRSAAGFDNANLDDNGDAPLDDDTF